MSFILDALKRAERERRLERPPDLSVVYEESDLPQGGRWPWFSVGVAFLVGAVVVALFLWPKTPPPEVSKSAKPATEVASRTPAQGRPLPQRSETRPAPRQKVASREGVSPPPSSPPKAQPEVRPRSKGAPQSIRPQAIKVPTIESGVPTPTKGPPDTTAEPAVSEEKVSGSGPSEPTLPKMPDTSTPPAVAVKETVPLEPPNIPSAPRSKAKEEPLKEPVEGVPLLKDLPDEIRQRLGKLEINVHGYSRDPAERLVFINMRKYRVGDRIGKDGPVLKRIIPGGVIVDYGKGQARLMVER